MSLIGAAARTRNVYLLAAAVATASVLFTGRPALAEVSLVKTPDWELFTEGRVNAFVSYGWGDAYPLALHTRFPNEIGVTPGGGLDTEDNVIPRTDASGNPVPGTLRSTRLRSGFF